MKRKLILLSTLISLPILLSGCLPLIAVGAAAGGSVAYVMGDVEASLSNTPTEIQAATEQAFDHLGIHMLSSSATELDMKVLGRTATDKKVTVIAKSEGNISKISVRVGNLGDQTLSQRIFDRIKAELP